jgi:hypothetical protein
MNYHEVIEDLSRRIDEGIRELSSAAHELAESQYELRKARAIAWAEAPPGTVPVREAWVEAKTADEELRHELAEGRRTTAVEALRSRRQQMSAVQSLMKADHIDFEDTKYSPR